MLGNAGAVEIDTGKEDVQVRFDNTVRYNIGRRIDSQDPAILGNLNADDGDRNFSKGSTVTNRLDLLSEFDVVYQKKFGARVSGAAWYDHAYAGSLDNASVATSNHLVGGAPALGLPDYTKRYYKGPSGEWLDAFAFGSFDLGSVPVGVRVGRHAINWGEALLSGGAIHGISYGQAPLDQSKAFASPGIEAKELYRPLTQISASAQATPELAFAAQYFFDWEASRLPESGSYLGLNDALQHGGESIYLAPGVRATHGADIGPKKRGDWGLAARWTPAWLEGTMGVYLRNFSDKLPAGVILKATAPREYYLNYAGDIDMLGVSLAKQIAGVSVGLDLNYRHNMPLVSDSVPVTSLAALPAAGDTLAARGNTVHAVLNAIGSINATPLFNSASWAAELTWNRWTSVTQGANFFKGREGYTAIDRVTKDFVGLAVNFTPTWFQVFPGADLSMPISYATGLSGNSAVASGGNKGTGNYALGLGLDLYSKYRFDLKYVDYFGDYTANAAGAIQVANGSQTFLKDRGGVFFTFKTSF
jgi:hypothetical protein